MDNNKELIDCLKEIIVQASRLRNHTKTSVSEIIMCQSIDIHAHRALELIKESRKNGKESPPSNQSKV